MTDTQTLTLAEFLLARIAEDEAAARAAQFSNGRWHRTGEWARATAVARDFGPDVVLERSGTLAWDDNEHIARHDPARVLAECEAKRRIITEAAPGIEKLQVLVDGEWGPEGEDEPERLLRLLALPYAAHEDYLQEWRP